MNTSELKEFNVFGDIAGRYDELMLLIDKMPKAVPISVGDMIDRGPHSYKVLEFFRHHGLAVQANHEHLLIDLWEDGKYYDRGMWFLNGGLATLRSFINDSKIGTTCCPDLLELIEAIHRNCRSQFLQAHEMHHLGKMVQKCLPWIRTVIPKDYIDWLKGLPQYLDIHGARITHAAINPSIPFNRALNYGNHAMSRECDQSIIWNRGGTRRNPDYFQIHGHMSNKNVNWLRDKQGVYGVNLDTSRGNKLTGMHWPSMEVYSVDYLTD